MTDSAATSHPDPYKMLVSELHMCGCPRCQDALKMHAVLDKLIANSVEQAAALERLRQSIESLGSLAKANAS